eukprot:819642_1
MSLSRRVTSFVFVLWCSQVHNEIDDELAICSVSIFTAHDLITSFPQQYIFCTTISKSNCQLYIFITFISFIYFVHSFAISHFLLKIHNILIIIGICCCAVIKCMPISSSITSNHIEITKYNTSIDSIHLFYFSETCVAFDGL